MKQFQLLYMAVVRPAILYELQVCGLQDNDVSLAASLIKSLKCLQNCCLHRVMEAYKQTSTAALERESNVMPVNLHMEHKAMQGSLKTASHPFAAKISQVVDTV